MSKNTTISESNKKVSDAQRRAAKKWDDAHVTRFSCICNNDIYNAMQSALADGQGKSRNDFVISAVKEKLTKLGYL